MIDVFMHTNSIPPPAPPPSNVILISKGVAGGFLAPHEAVLLEAVSLGRAVRFLSVLDGVMLFLSCPYFPLLLLYSWVSGELSLLVVRTAEIGVRMPPWWVFSDGEYRRYCHLVDALFLSSSGVCVCVCVWRRGFLPAKGV